MAGTPTAAPPVKVFLGSPWREPLDGRVRKLQIDSPAWREDGRCGTSFPLSNGAPSQYDPRANANEKGPCCSSLGCCGNSDAHCKCTSCVDFTYNGNSMILLTVNIRLYQAQLLLYYIHLFKLVEKDKDLDELGPGVHSLAIKSRG